MTGPACAAAAAAVDTLVAAAAPGVRPPGVVRRDVVLVSGPWLAGVSGVAVALRERLPDLAVVEATDLPAGEAPVAVVFVVSAAAALTESDCLLLDRAASDTDVVIGVVAKVDAHRHWQEMLGLARQTLAGYARRYRDVPWVGAAAAPDRREPRMGDLVAEVRKRLADPAVARRNRLRSWESRLLAEMGRYGRAGVAVVDPERRARVAQLQQQRDSAVRQRRLAKSERTIALRSRVAQARVQLSHFARKRCSSVRSELQEDAAGVTRRRLAEFEAYVHERVGEVVAEVDEGAGEQLADVADELGLTQAAQAARALPQVEVAEPALKSRRLETQLMMLLGSGFGLGVALTLSRLFADLAPQLRAVGAAACALVGLAVTVWVVSTRGLLRDRAVLDRWVGEVIAALRSTVEELVALRVLSAESALSAELAGQIEAEGGRVTGQVAALDAELRRHAAATARAAALRDQKMPPLRRALAAVRTELGEREPSESSVQSAE